MMRSKSLPELGFAAQPHEEQETTWSWGIMLHAFQRIGRVPLQALSRRRVRAASTLHSEPRTLRELYRVLLAWGRARGCARRPSTTAHEFAEQLARDLPHTSHALSALADYYALERYAERLCSDSELQHARTLLDEVTHTQEPAPYTPANPRRGAR